MLMAGLAAGLLLAYATSRLVTTLLYGVKPYDPWTMAAVALILLMGGLAADWDPSATGGSRGPDGGSSQRIKPSAETLRCLLPTSE
jgi:hypothetical protein